MKFSKGDSLFSAGILIGIAVLAGLLYLHSRERGTGSGKTIGKVFFKREVAMRKFSDRMVWEDIENGTALFSHDAVMTGNLSDAELVLDAGLRLKLEANTLVELDLEDSGLNLRLSGGGIKTAGALTTPTLVTTQGGQVVNVTDGSAAIRTQGNQVAVEVREGKVEVTQKDGKKQTVAKNEMLSAGKKSRFALEVLLPLEDAIVISAASTGRVKVKCSPDSPAKTAEVGRTNDFSGAQSYALSKGETVLNMPPGDWLMRCTGAAGEGTVSSVRRFRVVNAGAYKVYRPEKAEIPFEEKPVLRLEFKLPQSVNATHIEVADNAQFTAPVFSETRTGTALQITLPKAGKYFYRLTPDNTGPGRESGNLDVQTVPFVGSVTLVKTTTRVPVGFISLNAPVFSLPQVESGKALIGLEGNGKYQMQILKRGTATVVQSSEVTPGNIPVPTNLPGGKYEIRISSASEKATLNFEVRDKIKVDLLAPENGTVIYLPPGQKTATLPLSWRGSDEVPLYQLVLAEDAELKKILKKINVEGNDFRFTGLTARAYYLKVLVLENGVPRAESKTHAVTIEEKLPAVTGLYPRQHQEVDITRTTGLNLKWEPVSGATSYEVKIFQKRKGTLVLLDSRIVRATGFHIGDFKKLKEGDVLWEVSAQQADRNGRVVQKSQPVRSTVNLSFGAAPPAPEIIPIVEE